MKKMDIKKILVPVDFSETSEIAMNEAITLARLLKADLFLIHVIEYNGYYFTVVPESQIFLPSFPELEKVVQKRMDKIQAQIRKEFGIKAETYITTGDVHSEIINYSEKKKIDMIVMGTHGASGIAEVFIGSNAQRVVTLSDIPVLTIQKKKGKSGYKNILLPIDNSLHSREKLNIAIIIADLFGAKIHLVGLPDSKDKHELEKFKIKLDSVEKIIQADKLPYVTSIVHGNSLAKSAIKYASANKCDLIIINTGHESKITGIFLGAFAQQIVNHSKIPVLSCKHAQSEYSIDTPGFGI